MIRVLDVAPDALAGIDEISLFIARQSLQKARLFEVRGEGTLTDLLADPSGFRPLYPDDPSLAHVFHGRINRQPNHLFFFHIDGDVVTVLRVLHGARGDLREQPGEAASA